MMKKNKVPSCGNCFKVTLVGLIFIGIVVPQFVQVFLQLQQSTTKDETMLAPHICYEDIDRKREQVNMLEKHLTQLEIIRIKALQDLVNLDEKRVNLQNQIQLITGRKETLEKEQRSISSQMHRFRKQFELEQEVVRRKVVRNVIHVGIPKQRTVLTENKSVSSMIGVSKRTCSYENCFDFSLCSILKPFRFHVHQPVSDSFKETYKNLVRHEDFTSRISEACVYIVLISLDQQVAEVTHYLQSLATWKNSGTNHVVVLHSNTNTSDCFKIQDFDFKNAVLVSTVNCHGYLPEYDMLVPQDFLSSPEKQLWKYMLPLVPVERKYLLYFDSQLFETTQTITVTQNDIWDLQSYNTFFLNTNCNNEFIHRCLHGWCACGPKKIRTANIKQSKFNLIIADKSENYFFSYMIESFKYGSIPVVIGGHSMLPFANVIDWSQACIMISSQRLPELFYILKTIPLDDIVSLKRQGRFLYETYFSTEESIFNTILGYVRHNLDIQPSVMEDTKVEFVNNISYFPDTAEFTNTKFSSITFNHNFSYVGKNKFQAWNSYPGALKIYSVTPWNDPIPSRIQFLDEGNNVYMPIGDGKGGDGVAFSRSLGGDQPVEQFTVLMLTYDREEILMEALQRLSGMKYLNKVIVLWNHPVDPSPELSWPDIGSQIQVVRTGRNSLNNRFLPYGAIETEAVLSVDDDVYLRHDEIELAFRVWRENRARLVGFPGRHHSFNTTSKSFYYNPEHSCELSLVLTGAAFFHKYYSYLYTYNMNSAIREMVDDYMNCEDIAMNFLVAHITQKPPIKVTSRWTFRCPGCPVSLSAVSDHFEERNKCMDFFEQVYGYNPLKRTQFRADSILFKTRLPSTMTKCFQFV